MADDNELNLTTTDTFENYHTYEVDWTPDSITWSIDGVSMRTKNRNETWNATSNQYHYPQTPARIELSLWPAGLASNGQGTVDWAGGLVDWNSQDIKTNGYYYAMVKDVNVQCYNPPSGANVTGSDSYKYTGLGGTNNTVASTNDPTVLKSLLGTGTNMSADYASAVSSSSSASGSKTATSSASAATSDVATVPGLTGGGPGTNGHNGDSGSSVSSGSSGSASSSTSTAPSSSSTGIGGFSQGDGAKQGGGVPLKNERVLQGSVFAALVAVVGMIVL